MQFNRMFVAAAAVVAMSASAFATTITQWDFNGPAGVTTASIGAGTLTPIGGTTTSFASGEASGGSSDPTIGNPPDFGLGVTTFPAASALNETAGLEVRLDTTGYSNITVSWDQRHSNTASRYIAFYYALDGANFTRLDLSASNAQPGQTPAGGNPASVDGLFGPSGTFSAFDSSVTGAGDDWFNGRTVDLSAIPGAGENPDFGFRIVSSFGDGSAYQASSGGTYGTGSTWRFDMVTVAGTSVPEPTSLAALGLMGLLGLRRRRV